MVFVHWGDRANIESHPHCTPFPPCRTPLPPWLQPAEWGYQASQAGRASVIRLYLQGAAAVLYGAGHRETQEWLSQGHWYYLGLANHYLLLSQEPPVGTKGLQLINALQIALLTWQMLHLHWQSCVDKQCALRQKSRKCRGKGCQMKQQQTVQKQRGIHLVDNNHSPLDML